MDFLRRLKFYGFGFLLGIMIVYGVFGSRSCTTANEMKMQELLFQNMRLSQKAECKLKCLKKNVPLLKLELKQFEVNYDLTKVHAEPCGEYYVQPKKEHVNDYNYRLIIYDCDTISRIDDISVSGGANCNCD
jgi:hypothetical protein